MHVYFRAFLLWNCLEILHNKKSKAHANLLMRHYSFVQNKFSNINIFKLCTLLILLQQLGTTLVYIVKSETGN